MPNHTHQHHHTKPPHHTQSSQTHLTTHTPHTHKKFFFLNDQILICFFSGETRANCSIMPNHTHQTTTPHTHNHTTHTHKCTKTPHNTHHTHKYRQTQTPTHTPDTHTHTRFFDQIFIFFRGDQGPTWTYYSMEECPAKTCGEPEAHDATFKIVNHKPAHENLQVVCVGVVCVVFVYVFVCCVCVYVCGVCVCSCVWCVCSYVWC